MVKAVTVRPREMMTLSKVKNQENRNLIKSPTWKQFGRPDWVDLEF